MVLLVYSPQGLLGILDRFLADRRTRAASAARAAAAPTLEEMA
jgi:branched-chain amino acid transport system permease protein